jgi:hypothetical protein
MSRRDPVSGPSNIIPILLSALAVLALIIILASAKTASGHTPQDMVLEYDYDSRILNVTITHPVSNDPEHYIEKVKIKLNGDNLLEEKYDSQPDEDTFTYSYNVDAADGDSIEVVAECKVSGEIQRTITAHGADRPMDLSHAPSLTELEEGSDQVFTVTIESEGNPVEGVILTPVQSLGSCTIPAEGEPGSYSFTYTAPRVLTDTTVWINLTGTKDGYDDGTLSIQFTVTDIPGSNVILITHAPDPVSVNEGAIQQFTLDLEADTLVLEGAILDIQAEEGIISDLTETGGGGYTFMYQAPLVAGNLSISIFVNASKAGYEDGSITIDVPIVNIPEPLAIEVVTVNATMETGTNQSVTLYLDSNLNGVEGVTITLSAIFGSTSEVTETGGGTYAFSYFAPDVIADTHIVINITASKEGFNTAYLDVPITVFIIPPEPINLLCVKLFSEADPIVEGTTVNFTIYVLYDCNPFPGAQVEMTHLYGAVSTISDEGNGKFTFSYLAPDISTDTTESLTITGIKAGYGELTRTFNYTILTEGNRSGTRAESDGGDQPTNEEGDGGELDRDTARGVLDDQDPQDDTGDGGPMGETFGSHFLEIIVVLGSILVIVFIGVASRFRKND